MRIVFAGGGTGGHIIPAIALAQAWQERDPGAEIVFLGTAHGLERTLVPQAGYRLKLIHARPWRRRLDLELFRTGGAALYGFGQALAFLRRWHPALVVGTGGYVAGPVLLAAHLLGLPVVLQEQNALPGRTTRLLGRWADLVLLGYAEARAYFPCARHVVVTGNPVRREFARPPSRAEARRRLGLDEDAFTILALGGSQGARSINETMLALADRWPRLGKAQVLHQTGAPHFAGAAERLLKLGAQERPFGAGRQMALGPLHVVPFIQDMAAALAASDLVVSRAGALTLVEITNLGVPAILIPYPYAADNHQEFNARAIEKAGGARVILDRELSAPQLWDEIRDLYEHPDTLRAMGAASRALARPDAAARAAELMAGLLRRE
ncbi:MAG: undecaprenyldiphospho-muramoylpentapeptide beta-N-acetylglucosaminyltransferase [Firmicutes bacterium]|nr:undecaprenyldiphospho-muramoylpentapeptide beta-N-acetylglucosaminyltransferase [Bacillota bacterium]